MQLDKLKRNVGWQVQLMPVACRLDALGLALPERDDDWMIAQVDDVDITINNNIGISVLLGKDHIHHFTTNPQRTDGGVSHGFLSLHVQIYIQGAKAWVKPNLRPGEALPPAPVEIAERIVNQQYPNTSGLQNRLTEQGYRVIWANESNVAERVDSDGWEIVIDLDAGGRLQSFRARDRYEDQLLLKKPL